VQQLREAWQKVVGDCILEGNEVEEWEVDFPDFLLLMQHLLETDFAGIQAKTALIVRLRHRPGQRRSMAQGISKQNDRRYSSLPSASGFKRDSMTESLPTQEKDDRDGDLEADDMDGEVVRTQLPGEDVQEDDATTLLSSTLPPGEQEVDHELSEYVTDDSHVSLARLLFQNTRMPMRTSVGA
ncbi:unnamed protein product, partial [Polarella glacialis]